MAGFLAILGCLFIIVIGLLFVFGGMLGNEIGTFILGGVISAVGSGLLIKTLISFFTQ